MTARLVAVGVASLLAARCASSGAVPRPFPTPGGDPAVGASRPQPDDPASPTAWPVPPPPSVSPEAWAVTGTALSYRGAPYLNGGTTPSGFDCSGFVQYVFGRHGVVLPRETREQYRIGRPVDRDELAPGDLVFFSTVAPGASHVGILVDGDQFVHAPSSRGVVRVERLSAEYWRRRYLGARRP